MNEQPKKTYTLEDNLKFISFGIKDLIKAINDLTNVIAVQGGKEDKDEITF